LDIPPAPQEAYDGYLDYMCTYKKSEAENMSDENTENQNRSERYASDFSFMIISHSVWSTVIFAVFPMN